MLIRDKINTRLKDLDVLLKENLHLRNPELVFDRIADITKFWTILGDAERDYLNAARDAVRDGNVWK